MGPEAFGNFDLVKRVKLDFTDVVVSKWRSNVTGLTVIHLDYEGACDQIQSSVDKRLKPVNSSDCQWVFRCGNRK